LVGLRSEIHFASRLLRRHIIDRPDNRSGIGKTHGKSRIVGQARADRFRQSEIENLDAAVARDQDVVRLQIAVHDSSRVRSRESIRDLHRQIQ
jgi:hypothetical protein